MLNIIRGIINASGDIMKKDSLTIYDVFYIFIFGCIFGWLVEGIWSYFKRHMFINHSALVIGPFNIVYGIGAVVLSIMLYKIKDSNIFKIFITSFITGSILEYILSFLMEYMLGFVAWNYSKKFLNINGRICLVYSIFWGILGIFWIKLIYPRIKKIIENTNHQIGTKIMKILTVFLIFDAILTLAAVKRGREFEQDIPPSNAFEEKLDKYFGVEYLNNMYNLRWNKK